MGKREIIYYLETVAALGLKVACSSQLNELMKLSIKGQGHSLTLVKGHSDCKVKSLTFGLYNQVSDSGPHGPLVCRCFDKVRILAILHIETFVSFDFVPSLI